MTEILERVAVALWVASGEYPKTAIEVQAIWPIVKDRYASQARAAIEAMREPGAELCSAGAQGAWRDTSKGHDFYPLYCWQAMIDAALEKENESAVK